MIDVERDWNELWEEVEDVLAHGAIRKWKESGGKVVGWLCTYTPEEVIHAAGLLPVRIQGDPQKASLGDIYLQSNMCPFARSCIGKAVGGQYDFLDGVVAVHTCDAICKLYDVWRIYAPLPFNFLIDHPHKTSALSYHYHHKQLMKFVKAIEELAGHEVTERDLLQSISVYQENRSLLKRLYEWRKRDFPPLRGSEVLKMIEASALMPKQEHNALLKQLLKGLEKRQAPQRRGPRLVVSGSILENPDFLQLVEDCGGVVVSDDLCTGTRYFWDEIKIKGDPMEALSRHYMEKVPCACMHPPEKRFHHLREMVKQFDAQGVILYGLMFCDTFGYDFVAQKKSLEEAGIPVLQLELDYSSPAWAQMKTRVEAFLEVVAGTSQ